VAMSSAVRSTQGQGGRKGTRTPDILLVREALYQLSYAPRLLRAGTD
jgi:hypothetical protein